MTNENEEEVLVEETVEETPEETTQAEEVIEEKPQETLEAKKARLERQLEQTNKKLGVDTKQTFKPSKQSNDLDYGEKAYLTANGIKGSKEFDFVRNELKASGQNLDSLLENDYFQSKLEKFRAENKTSEATPTGKRSGGVTTDSVDYWMGKPIEEVPRDMRLKVVEAKMKKSSGGGSQFYNS